MSLLGHRRALKRLEEARWGRKGEGLTWEEHEAIFKRNLEATAAEEIILCARALAGTDEASELRRLAASRRDRPEQPAARAGPAPGQPAARVDPAPRRNSPRVWSESVRPGPHDILTWDEAMRVPWFDGSAAAAVTPPLPVDPGRPRDPWENWGFIRSPSYEGEVDGTIENEKSDNVEEET